MLSAGQFHTPASDRPWVRCLLSACPTPQVLQQLAITLPTERQSWGQMYAAYVEWLEAYPQVCNSSRLCIFGKTLMLHIQPHVEWLGQPPGVLPQSVCAWALGSNSRCTRL